MFFYEAYLFGNDIPYRAFPLTDVSYPYHFHRSYEIINVARGQLHIAIDDIDYELKPGDTAFIFPNQLHAFDPIAQTQIMITIFSPEMIPHFNQEYQSKVPVHPILHYQPLCAEEIQLDNVYLQKSFLYKMCGLLTRHTMFTTPKVHNPSQNLLHQILSYIERHYAKDCSLSSLSHELGYDYTYLSKLFQSKMGMSYTSYLNQFRIAHACELLKNTDLTMVDIASNCGYESIRSFNRNYSSIMRQTPREYKKRNN